MFFRNCSTLSLFAVAGLLSLSAPAFAQEISVSSHMVKVSDLDLQTDGGAAMLRHRVAAAARAVCGPAEMLGSPDFDSYDQCTTTAQRQASKQSDAMIASARSTRSYALVAQTN